MPDHPLRLLRFGSRRRIPIIFQSEAAECALACVAMVAAAYGHEAELSTLRRRFSVSIRGMTVRTLLSIAEGVGLQARALRVELDSLERFPLPAILHVDLRHFVVLAKIKRRRGAPCFLILDPVSGERWHSLQELSHRFTGVAVELAPSARFVTASERRPFRLKELWSRVIGVRRALTQVLLLSLMLQVCTLAAPLFIQISVNDALSSGDSALLRSLAIGFFGLAIVTAATSWLRSYVLINLGTSLAYQLVGNLVKHLFSLPLEWLQRRNVGELYYRIYNVERIADLLTNKVLGSLLDSALAATTLPAMILCSPRLAIVTVSIVGISSATRLLLVNKQDVRLQQVAVARSDEAGALMETLRGIAGLKAAAKEQDRYRVWRGLKAAEANAEIKLGHFVCAVDALEVCSLATENVAVVYFAMVLVMGGQLSLGTAFAYLTYKQGFLRVISALMATISDTRIIKGDLIRVADIAREQPEDESDSFEHAVRVSGSLQVRDMRFRYGRFDPEILRGVSFDIKAGETVAVVGTSGSGKTTLMRILQGLYRPSSGQVCVDGQPIESYGVRSYRRQIGVVAQDDTLYAGTIAENIAFFDSEIDMSRVVECAKLAAVHLTIQQMPMQYESHVGDMGSAFSGGQLQRIFLARALYARPSILFMDEGTAHLDIQTEADVNASIRALGITRVLAAHRPETIHLADRILILADGVITEGTNGCFSAAPERETIRA